MFQTVINAFQSTPPRGGRPFVDRPQKLKFVYFNPRPREGGDGCRDDGYHRRLSISIHAPARGATPCRGKSRGDTWHFNPRPREGGDYIFGAIIDTIIISIHAPARGATTIWRAATTTYPYFNPRPREGSDGGVCERCGGHNAISIHAPARGATALMSSDISGEGFQSTPPRGERQLYQRERFDTFKFQSTPPRGERRWAGPCLVPSRYFNPRPREGSDSKDAQFYLRIFDKQVELLRFWGKMRGGCLRNPEKDRRFLGKSLANLPEISGHLDFAGA